jgi:hypothetical protein
VLELGKHDWSIFTISLYDDDMLVGSVMDRLVYASDARLQSVNILLLWR